jgi:ubiquinone biosynthesis protein
VRQTYRKLILPVSVVLRMQRIAYLMTRHGLAGSLGALGFEISKRGLKYVGLTDAPTIPLDAAFGRELARTLVRLGPTFIKLGQVLASRPDWLGEAAAEELRVLFSQVPSVPFRQISRTLNKELGRKKISSAFQSIDEKPMATASLGQVHRAVLKDGSRVIVKVQKKGASETVLSDLTILEGLARSIHLLQPSWQLRTAFEDFKTATLCEIDYQKEAENISRFQRNYKKIFAASSVRFPKFFPELSTSKVLVMEPMQGQQLSLLKKGSTVARNAAEQSLAAILEQIFDHGFFHADPHAGNLFFQEETGQIGFIDMGLVGQLRPEDKRKFLEVVLAILKRDRSRLAKSLYALGTPGKKTDYKKFEMGIEVLLDEVRDKGPKNVSLEAMVNQLLAIARKNQITIPNRYIMLIRSCLVIEGVARNLDPKISVFEIATPIVARSLLKTYNPFSFLKRR